MDKQHVDNLVADLESRANCTDEATCNLMLEAAKVIAALTQRPEAQAAQVVDVVEDGWVQIEVSALTGSGKSALCKEVVILCRALGLHVEWDDQGEARMTGGDAAGELELYAPKVRVIERNIPRPKATHQPKGECVVSGVDVVAWLHDQPGRVDVIHARVKDLLVKADDLGASASELSRPEPKHEHYTIPLFYRPHVVDDLMVDRAIAAFISAGKRERALPSVSDRWMREALEAALANVQPARKGE